MYLLNTKTECVQMLKTESINSTMKQEILAVMFEFSVEFWYILTTVEMNTNNLIIPPYLPSFLSHFFKKIKINKLQYPGNASPSYYVIPKF